MALISGLEPEFFGRQPNVVTSGPYQHIKNTVAAITVVTYRRHVGHLLAPLHSRVKVNHLFPATCTGFLLLSSEPHTTTERRHSQLKVADI